ncbi:hypothetical protein [Clostridium luticellarii]|uniref:Adhesin domain-containing protein n=1 Tax=Clostridium luticellarii TaxID=1691940 RepID=A0A2T0BPC2_9CLOT|nr:hypothetical protein [Clostridium luticellarii]PRR85724.1 hypothetical protein CLLU_12130 [Clostridium luticellarii]
MSSRKLLIFDFCIATAILLSGCSTGKIHVISDTLKNPIIHNVYNTSKQPNVNVLSIFNSSGNVKITKSSSNELKVDVKLIQTKNLTDIDKKLKNLTVKPQIKNGILFYQPLYAKNNSENYWMWITENLNANGIYIDFDIEVPSSIREIRVFNGTGNIDLRNISAKIYAQTDVGNITGKEIEPLDNAVFKDDVPFSDKLNDIDMDFSNIDRANSITAGSNTGSVILKLPHSAEYTHNEIKSSDMNLEYPYHSNSKQRFDYCIKQSLEPSKIISAKHNKTIITTVPIEKSSNNVLIIKK